jgi:hypothetical protein
MDFRHYGGLKMTALLPSFSLVSIWDYLALAAGIGFGMAVFGAPISSLQGSLQHSDTVE